MKYTYNCPACHTPLQDNSPAQSLDCAKCHLKYPIKDGIPVLIINQATEYA